MRLTIFQLENWREIGATLARNKTRTFLTAFGIFWGTAMLAMLLGGAEGFKGIMSRNFAGLATNMGGMGSNPRSISYMGFNKGSYWTLTTEDVDDIRRIAPAIEYSSAINGRGVTGVYSVRSKAAQAMGIEPEYGNIMLPVIYEGRFINARDYSETRKVVVLGRNIASELFGNESPIGKRLSLNGVYFTCIGVAGQVGEASIMGRIDDNYIIPGSTLRQAFNQGNSVGFFIYTAPAGHKPDENEAAIRRFLSGRHAIHPADSQAFWFMDLSEMFDQINSIFMGIAILAGFVGAGSLLAGVIGVGNIMWIVVKERTHEFGHTPRNRGHPGRHHRAGVERERVADPRSRYCRRMLRYHSARYCRLLHYRPHARQGRLRNLFRPRPCHRGHVLRPRQRGRHTTGHQGHAYQTHRGPQGQINLIFRNL